MKEHRPAMLVSAALVLLGACCVALRIKTQQEGQVWDIVNLTRLSPGSQGTLAIVLLLPIGALVTAVSRNIIGIQTFGTFTPSLLAISFVRADLFTAAMVFLAVLAAGLLARAALSRLKLLTVSRLSVILVLIVACLTLAVSALQHMDLAPSAHAMLLPMVILTMMVERFYIGVEEDGLSYAMKVLAGTIAVALCCVLLFRIGTLESALLNFPETLLFITAMLVLIGRYTGYRLVELRRFRDIVRIQDMNQQQ